MLKIKLVMYPLLLALIVAPVVGGCTVQRKPTPAPNPRSIAPTPPGPTVTPGPATTPAPTPTRNIVPPGPTGTAPVDANREAQRMATLVSRIKDVRAASVVLSGTTAYVGLDVTGKVTDARISSIKKEAATVIRREDPRITTVNVATDAPTVGKIRRIALGIARGTPLANFANELAQIGRRLTNVK